MESIWIVVADSSRARILSTNGNNKPLNEIVTLVHPEVRLHEGDLVSDRAGRERNPGATGHSMGGERAAKEEGTVRFANELCGALESARSRGEFDKLYLIAAPAFLGTIRKHQSSAVQRITGGEVAKNIAIQDLQAIRQHLPERL